MIAKRFCSGAAAGLTMILMGGAASTLTAQGQGAQAGADSAFVQTAASGGLAEVQLGKLAMRKAASPDVKQFGQQMVNDHSQANQQLMSAAQEAGMVPPATLLPKHKAAVSQLGTKTGAAFDTAYMSLMVKDHAEQTQVFQQESASGSAEALRQVAAQTLPSLQQHLSMAKQVAGKVGADTTGAANQAGQSSSSR
jgi:putative membrane protein